MKKTMTRRILTVSGRQVTFLVMDAEDFAVLCSLLRKQFGDELAEIEQEGWLPVVRRAKETADLFQRFGIKTGWLAASVYGLAERLRKPLEIRLAARD